VRFVDLVLIDKGTLYFAISTFDMTSPHIAELKIKITKCSGM